MKFYLLYNGERIIKLMPKKFENYEGEVKEIEFIDFQEANDFLLDKTREYIRKYSTEGSDKIEG